MTSGTSGIDYFISGDRMEHPRRTRTPDDSYSEQVPRMAENGTIGFVTRACFSCITAFFDGLIQNRSHFVCSRNLLPPPPH